jgi:predicted amidohydrolase YtcJ
MGKPNFAVFVDLENAGAKESILTNIIEKVKIRGDILIGKVYGYTDPDYRGVLSVTKENLFEMVRVGHELGWQLTAHTTGGGAVDLLLDAYEAADKVSPVRGRRHNVMHGNFVNARAIERAKKLGVIFDSQIAWLHCDGDTLQHVFGPERIKELLPFRSLIDAGIVVAGGSDHMIKFDSRDAINPYHPFYGMWMAITRKTVDGAVLGPEQRVTRDEALRMWTVSGAYDSFDEAVKGSIEPGKLADFVVISKDYLTCPEDEIKDIEALMTVVDGKVVYERK